LCGRFRKIKVLASLFDQLPILYQCFSIKNGKDLEQTIPVMARGHQKNGVKKIARAEPEPPQAARKRVLFERILARIRNDCSKRVHPVSARPAIFSHFSAALIFFATFLHQGKKVVRETRASEQ